MLIFHGKVRVAFEVFTKAIDFAAGRADFGLDRAVIYIDNLDRIVEFLRVMNDSANEV